MSLYGTIQQQPRHYDMFAVVRMLERDNPALPRLGENAVLRDEFLRLSQNPYFAFPAANLEGFERTENGWRMTVRFLGQFGPQGSLPLALSEEAYAWLLRNDTSFPRFVEVISSRFLALFFRAWANARPIAQHDRPESDRFLTYIGAQIGIGSPTLRNRDSVEDERKLALAGVIGAKAKSASRLRSFLGGLFGLKVEVEEFIGSQLALNPGDRTRLGAAQSTLGGDIVLGSSVFSVQDKIRIRVFARDLAQYMDFLPSGSRCVELVDAVHFYIGDELDWDVELALPVKDVEATVLGGHRARSAAVRSADEADRGAPASGIGMLGWTTWIAPNWAATDAYRCDARFHPTEIRRDKSLARTTASIS